jgi:phage shock protein PspC (stress-responsive transcriptional regulator)
MNWLHKFVAQFLYILIAVVNLFAFHLLLWFIMALLRPGKGRAFENIIEKVDTFYADSN